MSRSPGLPPFIVARILVFLSLIGLSGSAPAHVPHDIIYSLDASPDFAETGMILSSSTQFGEGHLVSRNHGETFSESHRGMDRSLVTGHTYSPDFSNDGTIYTVTKKGYYKSTDRGRNWTHQKPFAAEPVLDVCFAPDHAGTKGLYVLTTTGVHRVRNDGGSMKTILEKAPITFGKLRIADGKLYAHAVHYKQQKKKKGMEHIDFLTGTMDVLDLGAGTWSGFDDRFDSAVISDFDVTRTDAGLHFLVSLKDGTVHLKEGEKPWEQVFQRKGDYTAKLRFSPDYANDRTMAAGTAKGFVFMSETGGRQWELRSNGLSRWVHHTDILVTQLQFSPGYKDDKTILLGKTTGVYKTTDRGRSWRPINVWNTKWGYYVLPAPGKDSRDVFTATYNSGISRSRDHGETWESANIGITSAFANGMVLSPMYDDEAANGIYRIMTRAVRMIPDSRAYLGVYCRLAFDPGYAVEVYFFGNATTIEN